jgi:hypothetical protein
MTPASDHKQPGRERESMLDLVNHPGEQGSGGMNDLKQAVTQAERRSGLAFLVLGLLAVVGGPVIFTAQMLNKSLLAPWYVPILATLGALLVAWSLVQSRTLWRWGVAGVSALFAALVWLWMLVGLAIPPYTGPVTVGQAFPGFETRLASGAAFRQEDLRGDKDTILLFFRGHW